MELVRQGLKMMRLVSVRWCPTHYDSQVEPVNNRTFILTRRHKIELFQIQNLRPMTQFRSDPVGIYIFNWRC